MYIIQVNKGSLGRYENNFDDFQLTHAVRGLSHINIRGTGGGGVTLRERLYILFLLLF